MPLRRLLSRLGLASERRSTGQRVPIFVGAKLELDVITLEGTARDLSDGGVFLETSAPLAPGLRGLLSRKGSTEQIPVRVSWRRAAGGDQPAGLGLAFESA
jgi:hypothetical protein